MYIQEIEIDNFKSFSGKITIPFYDGFTTISGPNGSGKSNIIDSVLFALGLSTSRTLRAEKVSQLITTHNNRNEASVQIKFADTGNDGNLVIKRRIKKAGSGNYISTYYLNGKTATLSDIHSVLSDYNITPGSYNVIMQGDVTGIINTSPTERRKILDEIAGVADFDRRIEHATMELEEVASRVEKSNLILGELDTRIVELEEESKVALEYQKLKEEKTDLESKISLVKYFDIKTSLERLHESVLDGQKQKKNKEKDLEDLNTELLTAQEKLKEASELVKTKGEGEQIEIKKHAEALKGDIARKTDAIKYIDKQIADNLQRKENLEQEIVDLTEKIEDIKLKIENKQEEIKVIEHNIKREKEELNTKISEISSLNDSASKKVEKRNELRHELENLKDEENLQLKKKLPLEQSLSAFKKDIKEAKEELAKLEEIKKDREDNKDKLVVLVEELEKEQNDLKNLQERRFKELDITKNEIADTNHNIQLAYRKVASLEASKKAAEETGYGYAVDTVSKSGLAGVHEPLGKLFDAEDEYIAAIEVALGGRIRSIVVDSQDTAKIAIEILKSSNSGRATFLPLDKINVAPKNLKAPNVKGIVDFAINLIDCDNVYLPVFYHALGDTLIVEDYETAKKFTGKYRMVTLDGSVFEKSAAITGGAIKQSTLRFNQQKELDKYILRLEELENKANELQIKQKNIEDELSTIRKNYSSTMTEFNHKKFELENFEKTEQETDERIRKNTLLIEELTPQISELEKEVKKIEETESRIKDKIERLSKEIDTVEGELPKDELTRLNDLTQSIEFEIKRLEGQLNNANNDITRFNMDIEFSNESISKHKERIEKFDEENKTLEEEKVKHREEIASIEVQLEELNKKIKEMGEKLGEYQKQRDEAQQSVLGIDRKKNIIETDIQRLEEQIESYKTRRRELEPELEQKREELLEAGYNVSSLKMPDISLDEVTKNILKIEKKMSSLGDVNMKAITQYEETKGRQGELREKIETLSTERGQILERMAGYEEQKKQSFMDTFNDVNENFKQIFNILTDGEGRLVLENPEDPLNGGMTIEAQPRDKKAQRLEGMSGGEKSITALAFVFAIQRHMPAPFYAFDEVDMHLDGINVERLSDMIKKQSEATQFIVVSLRKPMIESAQRTIGVTQKQAGVTKVTGVRLSGD